MALTLIDQYNLATNDQDFRGRVRASLFAVAVTKFSDTPDADPARQAKRLALASEIVRNPAGRVDQFTWIVVSRPSMPTTADAVTDTLIGTAVTNTFDQAAQQLVS